MNWLLNDVPLYELGLSGARLTYANQAPDRLDVRHLAARWDADTLFEFGEEVVFKREPDGGGDPVCVFRGRAREFPRFLGLLGQGGEERLNYAFLGPWADLERRVLLQNQKVVLDPEASTESISVPQGLLVLAQDDGGASVMLGQALETCVQAAIDAGVGIALGEIEGFDFYVPWDEIADLTIADAIVRLLQSAPDAVVTFDYAPEVPEINIRRRAALASASVPISLDGLGEFPAYAALDTLSIRARPDLQVPFVSIAYRRVNRHNGKSWITVEKETAGVGTETMEGALVRTVQLAGRDTSSTILTQQCRTVPLSVYLGNGVLDATVVTAASDADAFAALSKFWKRKIPALAAADVVIKGFKNRVRRAAEVADEEGEPITPALDVTLGRELIEGQITPWMREGTLNREAQEQNYEARIAYSVAGVDQVDEDGFGVNHFAGVMATNAETKIYNFIDSVDGTVQEPTPVGLAAALFAALGPLQHEGTCTIFEQECSLAFRPGGLLNLTGGRAEWTGMGALIQSARADLDAWRTELDFGWPRALDIADLVDVARSGRLKRQATGGLNRATAAI